MNKKTIMMLKKQFVPNSKVKISSNNDFEIGWIKNVCDDGVIEIYVEGKIEKYDIYNHKIELLIEVPEPICKSINNMIAEGINITKISDVKNYALSHGDENLLNYIKQNLRTYLTFIKN